MLAASTQAHLVFAAPEVDMMACRSPCCHHKGHHSQYQAHYRLHSQKRHHRMLLGRSRWLPAHMATEFPLNLNLSRAACRSPCCHRQGRHLPCQAHHPPHWWKHRHRMLLKGSRWLPAHMGTECPLNLTLSRTSWHAGHPAVTTRVAATCAQRTNPHTGGSAARGCFWGDHAGCQHTTPLYAACTRA